MILPCITFSQDTYQITQEQIEVANRIFVEHKYLKSKVEFLEEYSKNLEISDSLCTEMYKERTKQVETLNNEVSNLNLTIKRQSKKIKIRNCGLIASGVLLIICLL